MFRIARPGCRPRRGVTLIMIGVLLVVLCGIAGFAVDLGRVAVCRTQIQAAADSAALAGASALGTDKLILLAATNPQTAETASARDLAQIFARANTYDLNGSKTIALDRTNDVDIGVLATPITPDSAFSTPFLGPYNSVRVRTYIDANHGGNLNLLFAPAMGKLTASLQATSVATVELRSIATLKAISGQRSPILPITMSLSDWQKMVNKQTGVDLLRYDDANGTVVAGSDGLQEQQLYPGSNGTSSNNGLLQFGTSSHSGSVLADQISNGPDYGQVIAEWPPDGSPPWGAQHSFTIGADPGWRSTNFDALESAVGQVRVIPINDGTSPGNGSNGSYTIVALAPVRVMSSIKGGNGKGLAMVQTAVISSPSVVPSTTVAGAGQGGVPISRLTH